MENSKKTAPLYTLVIPLAVTLLVACVTAGYCAYRYLNNRAYRERWKDYDGCGLA